MAAQMQTALAIEQGGKEPRKSLGRPEEAPGSPSPGPQSSAPDTANQSSADGDSCSDAHGAMFKARPCNPPEAPHPPEAQNSSTASLDAGQTSDEDYGLADGWNDACGIATRLIRGKSTSAERSEPEPAQELHSEPSDDSESDYQVLQRMLADLQDQSWLISQDQLGVCTHNDEGKTDVRLGRGSFGAVYKGIMNRSVAVAIKSILNPTMRAKMEFVNEMAMLMNLRHQNIVQCLGAVIDRKNLLLVMELMPRGDLFRNLQRDREGVLRWHKRGHQVMLDIVRGVLHMHDLGIVHQDIKSGNVMMSRDFTAKIGDVGLAAVLAFSSNRQSSPGTLEWTAPEILQGETASTQADVYSLGIVLWEVLTGEAPKRGALRALKVPEDCPAEIAEIVERCMETNSGDRPTTLQLFECLTSNSLPPSRPLSQKSL
ncbi:hypothetical protein WJX74_005997 [Apatococcus lobatus]|uniref:Protein kinase domain-containing protein n=1 Tax=Apatococcus lobatus TaxID=904363 RepID=A0AAW1S9X6_9CHLO